MIEKIGRVLHVVPPPALEEEQMLRDDIEERVEAVVAKIDSLEARVERLEGKPDVTGKSVDGT